MLIKNGTIIDGTGEKRYKADIRIKDGVIEEIKKDLKERSGEETISAAGAYVTPGFVDILNHSDAFATIFENPAQESLLRQGITTILMGNCGSSLAPLKDAVFINSIQKWGDPSKININWLTMKEYLSELERHKFGVNIATLAGHSTIRRGFVGSEPRMLTGEEMRKMEYMINNALNEGAFGVSVGLAYAHGNPADGKELRMVMETVKNYNALFSAHIRDESKDFKHSVEEIIQLARETGANTEFSHLKVSGENSKDKYSEALDALADKENINFDIYPYTTTASVLYSFLPDWAKEGGNMTLLDNLKLSGFKQKLVQEMKNDSYSYKDMIVAMGDMNPSYYGKTIEDIAKNQETDPEEAALNLITASENRVIVFAKTISDENLKLAMQHPKSIVSSDGVGYKEEDSERKEYVHPRYFGAFPRFINKYVKEEKLLSLEDAIKKTTLVPAEKIGFKNRGKIAKGYNADIVILDRKKLKDNSTFEDPYHYPDGVKYVLVNGEVAVEKGELKELAGEVLKAR
ncbi:MAG: amidohydrolase family protein [Candidatus Spechtbacterales bacterium]